MLVNKMDLFSACRAPKQTKDVEQRIKAGTALEWNEQINNRETAFEALCGNDRLSHTLVQIALKNGARVTVVSLRSFLQTKIDINVFKTMLSKIDLTVANAFETLRNSMFLGGSDFFCAIIEKYPELLEHNDDDGLNILELILLHDLIIHDYVSKLIKLGVKFRIMPKTISVFARSYDLIKNHVNISDIEYVYHLIFFLACYSTRQYRSTRYTKYINILSDVIHNNDIDVNHEFTFDEMFIAHSYMDDVFEGPINLFPKYTMLTAMMLSGSSEIVLYLLENGAEFMNVRNHLHANDVQFTLICNVHNDIDFKCAELVISQINPNKLKLTKEEYLHYCRAPIGTPEEMFEPVDVEYDDHLFPEHNEDGQHRCGMIECILYDNHNSYANRLFKLLSNAGICIPDRAYDYVNKFLENKEEKLLYASHGKEYIDRMKETKNIFDHHKQLIETESHPLQQYNKIVATIAQRFPIELSLMIADYVNVWYMNKDSVRKVTSDVIYEIRMKFIKSIATLPYWNRKVKIRLGCSKKCKRVFYANMFPAYKKSKNHSDCRYEAESQEASPNQLRKAESPQESVFIISNGYYNVLTELE
jgi:hypothetical protein